MKVYYYLLFRIYRFYIDKINEKQIPLFYTCCVSTTLVYFNLYTTYTYLIYKGLFKDILPNKYYVLIPIGAILILNYFAFVKNKVFLDYKFKKDIKGGMAIIFYLVISIGLFIMVANCNRAKIKQQRLNHPTANPIKQKPSLEGKIRKWLNDAF